MYENSTQVLRKELPLYFQRYAGILQYNFLCLLVFIEIYLITIIIMILTCGFIYLYR